MYDADAKKQKRREDRSLRVNGSVYQRKPWTISLDRELDDHRDRLEEIGVEYRKQAAIVGQYGDDGTELTPAERHTPKQVSAARAKLKSLDSETLLEQMAMIAAVVEPSDNGEKLSVATLEAHLELEDLSPVLEMLQGGEETVGGATPTGDSVSA